MWAGHKALSRADTDAHVLLKVLASAPVCSNYLQEPFLTPLPTILRHEPHQRGRRAFRGRWEVGPLTPPAGAALRKPGGSTVWSGHVLQIPRLKSYLLGLLAQNRPERTKPEDRHMGFLSLSEFLTGFPAWAQHRAWQWGPASLSAGRSVLVTAALMSSATKGTTWHRARESKGRPM